MAEKPADIQTQVVHAGEGRTLPAGEPTSTPIYASATYTYESMAEMDRVFAGESAGYVYTRHGNPTTDALADALRMIEGGATACAYASGMAALHAALLCCDLRSGATVLASQDLYGATTGLLQTILSPFGIESVTVDFNDIDQVRSAARESKPRVILAETISNPLLKVCDIDACADIAKQVNARLIIDNTFASPILCRPLQHGADIVVHSATKWLSGHADAMGGVVISRHQSDTESLIRTMKVVGGVLSPYEAHQILRGTKTLAVRMQRHCENAAKLAANLKGNPRIARVSYPELESAERKDVAKRVLQAGYFGALVSIELVDNTRDAAFRFMDALKLCIRSTSLGDVFTSVLHPASASHRDLPIERRAELGINEGLIRISVGIENIKDIIGDLEQALNAVSAPETAVSVSAQQ
jgi:cystathionine beta-lyase/cystathionine gamma-synthase